jgi:outer membrane protein TolC
MKRVWMGLLIIISFTPAALKAQHVSLTLNDALDAAMKNNYEIAIASLDQEGARAKYQQTNAVFLPQIKLSYAAMATNNPLNAFGFKLQQQSITASDFNPELLNNPATTQNFLTKVEWQQPLLNIDMMLMRQSAQANQDIYAFKAKRTKEFLMFEVQKSYAQLQLAHQAKNVLEGTLQTVKSIYNSTNNRFQQGYLQKSDVLQVQVQLTTTENMLAEANSNVKNASDHLSLLMGSSPGVIYLADTTRKMNSLKVIEGSVPANRADFLAMNAAISAQEKMIQSGKMSYLPKLNAFGEYMFNDREAFGFSSDTYLAGLQLSWTIFNGTATRHKVAERVIERNKTERQLSYQKEQAQLELNKTQRQLDDATFAVRQQDIAISQASEALRILQNRYLQGLVTTTDLLQAETLLSQQKLNQAQAIFQYNTTIAYLEFLTSTSEQ